MAHLSLGLFSVEFQERAVHEFLLSLLPAVDGCEEPLVGLHADEDGIDLGVGGRLPLEKLLLLVDLNYLLTNLIQTLLQTEVGEKELLVQVTKYKRSTVSSPV